MAKNNFDFKVIEKKWADFWEKEKIYKFDVKTKKKIFSFDTPPPTVSGRLHMGHALGDSHQDFFARFKRMRGFEVLNPFGTDNNGLPTLKLVEKEKKVDSKKMKRGDFIELADKMIHEEFIPMFLKDMKKLGVSADFDIFYSTIDKRARRISQKSFIDLYKMGREYRTDAPALWCPCCQTTISQVELEDKEVAGMFSDIVLKVIEAPKGVHHRVGPEEGGASSSSSPSVNKDINTKGNLVISTTRPELFPASVAVFYHPKDKRYKHLKGKMAKIPLFNIEVPIMEDEGAEMDKGTGIAYSATFGDQKDMEWQKQYNLPIKEAISKDGKMTSLAGKYKGMKIKEAREEIVKDLKKGGFLKSKKNIRHIINVCERCKNPVEFINHKQWFVKYLDLKKDLLKWGNKIKWIPPHMKVHYDNWVKGLKWDWCISRQIPFGISFPVWYCAKCDEVILALEKDLPVVPMETKPPVNECPKCKSKEFIPEKDIINTWATSSLTPTIVKELLEGTPAHKKIKDKPFSIRRNGQDIITFWDFNTIVKSQLHYGKNPWDELYINGWMLGRDGKKMSKSLGNGVSPQEIFEKYGADVLRYLCASIGPAEAVAFSDKELVAGKRFSTKLLNASRFVFMNLEDWNGKRPKKLEKLDSLFFGEFNQVVKEVTKAYEIYNISRAKLLLENFFWKMFCDNYLEIIKKRIYNEKGEKKISAQYTLYKVLSGILKMASPIMPFITEEIYQEHFWKYEKTKSIHISEWPEVGKIRKEETFNLLIGVISKIRYEKTKAGKPMNFEIVLTIEKKDKEKLKDVLEDLKNVTVAKEIKEGKFKVGF